MTGGGSEQEMWVDMKEAAKELGIGFNTVDRKRARGDLPSRKDPLGKWMVDISKVTPEALSLTRHLSERRYPDPESNLAIGRENAWLRQRLEEAHGIILALAERIPKTL